MRVIQLTAPGVIKALVLMGKEVLLRNTYLTIWVIFFPFKFPKLGITGQRRDSALEATTVTYFPQQQFSHLLGYSS